MNLGRSLRTSKENREHQGVSNIDFEIMQASTGFFPNLSPTKKTQKATWKMCPSAAPSDFGPQLHGRGTPPVRCGWTVELPFFWLPWKDLSLYRLRLNCCGRGWLGCSGGHKQILKVLKYVFAWRRKGGAGVDVVRYPLRIYHIYMGKSSCCPASSTKMVVLYTLQVQRFSKTRSFVKDQVLLDLFVRLKFSHLPTSLALTTCYNHLSPGKLGPWRFTVLSR